MSETTPTCKMHGEYEDIKCGNPALPGDPDGFCILHSRENEKDKDGAFTTAVKDKLNRKDYDFRGVFFPGPMVFNGYKFHKRSNFSEAVFRGKADFIKAIFRGKADFSRATFNDRADFSGAIFRRNADFVCCTFTMKAYFYVTIFDGDVDFSDVIFTTSSNFSGTTFTGFADFSGANFGGFAHFVGVKFSGDADFIGTTINNQMVFRNTNHFKVGEPPLSPILGYFRLFNFGDKGKLFFYDLSLAQCSFTGTDLRRPEFHHVSWYSYRGRQAVYDEVLMREEEKSDPWFWTWFWTWVSCHLSMRFFSLETGIQLSQYLDEEFLPPDPPWGDSYGEVECLYRYLKINYETVNDYKNAGDFHYGEMEMHRLASKWRWFPFYWYNLYKVLSGFGERPSLALGCLAGFLLALPLLVWGVGLDRVTGGITPGFLETFTYIFEKVTFQRPSPLSNLNFLGSFISNLSLLIIPGQAALFLLALRNRLGRRR